MWSKAFTDACPCIFTRKTKVQGGQLPALLFETTSTKPEHNGPRYCTRNYACLENQYWSQFSLSQWSVQLQINKCVMLFELHNNTGVPFEMKNLYKLAGFKTLLNCVNLDKY